MAPRGRRFGGFATSALVGALAVLTAGIGAAPVAADTVLGSTLEDTYETTFGATSGISVYQVAAPPSEVLSAPGPGTITSWKVRSGDLNAKYELRILRPSGGGFTSAGTSAALTVPDGEDKVRASAASMHVKSGDRVALYVVKGSGAPINNVAAPMADELNYVADPFGEGATKEPSLAPPLGNTQELLLQADFTPGAPVNIAPPAITGEARAGVTLEAAEGTWEGATSFAYQWTRCAGAACAPIAGATGPAYTPTEADEGFQLRVDVTGTGEGGKTTASSALTDGVKPAPPRAPVSTGAPLLSGEARETETLTGTTGSWTGTPTSFSYLWLRCSSASGTGCVAVEGATTAAYRLTHADAGSTMRLQVTAGNGLGSTTAVSAPSAVVQALAVRARFTVSPNPTCAGVATHFDGSLSQTPNGPITRYRYTYKNLPLLWAGLAEQQGLTRDEYLAGVPSIVLSDGSDPRPTQTFPFDRAWTYGVDIGTYEEGKGSFVRDPMLVTLEVTDFAGAKSSFSEWVYFSADHTQYTYRPGWVCPKVSVVEAAKLPVLVGRVVVSKTSLLETVRCVTVAPCVGSVSTYPLRPRFASASASARESQTIAAAPYFTIAGHHNARIRQKLTKFGRHLLAGGKSVRALERLTSIDAVGHTKTRSLRIVLRF